MNCRRLEPCFLIRACRFHQSALTSKTKRGHHRDPRNSQQKLVPRFRVMECVACGPRPFLSTPLDGIYVLRGGIGRLIQKGGSFVGDLFDRSLGYRFCRRAPFLNLFFRGCGYIRRLFRYSFLQGNSLLLNCARYCAGLLSKPALRFGYVVLRPAVTWQALEWCAKD